MKIFTVKFALYTLIVGALCIAVTGCGTAKMQRGAAIGAGAGATVGALIGKTAGNTALGTIIGGAIGGTAGAYIGHKMDDAMIGGKPEIANASVSKQGDGYIVKFDKELQFNKGSFDVSEESQTQLKNLAVYLKRSLQANVTITGYTDTSGTPDENKELSLKRAEAVKSVLVADSVNADRLNTKGDGSSNPVADHASPDGQAKNNIVEIMIFTNDKARAQAKDK